MQGITLPIIKEKKMLVLTRKPDQQIILGNGLIKIKLLQIHGNIARIGFEAPAHIAVDREEIFLQKLLNGEINGVQL